MLACLDKLLTVYQILNFQAKILHRTEIAYIIVRTILMAANHNYMRARPGECLCSELLLTMTLRCYKN